jgi:beta-glucosidase
MVTATPSQQVDATVAARVEELLNRMTLAEKIGQMTLVEKNSIEPEDIAALGIGGLLSGGGGYPKAGNSPAQWAEMVDSFQRRALSSRLAIPLIYGVDAVHGHGNVRGATVFPHHIGLGAANDPALITAIGRATALEMAATGIYWNYAPGVMVPQDIRWGRTYEGYGERPELVSEMATAYLRGLQSPDLLHPNRVIGTPKHFVGDGGTRWGTGSSGYQIDQGDTQADEATMRSLHLPPYIAAIKSGARSIMVSYSSWNGKKMHAQAYWINEVLKGELGFSGFVVSDWGAIDQIAPDYYTAVVAAINAGIDMNMVPYHYHRFIETLTQAVQAGDVPMSRIDDAVRRILTVKFEMGLFEQPFSRPDLLPLVGSAEHRALARQAVAASLVLLKNEGGLLPLSPDIRHLYVAGAAADDIGIQSGGWTIEWQGQKGNITPGTTILEGIRQAVGPNTVVEYSRSGDFQGDVTAADAVCLAVVGELPYAEGKGDSETLNLPPGENRVLRRLEETCAHLVVVLISGRPLLVADHLARWDALVAAWLPGSEGAGVADGLFGKVPFRGKTPFTWPAALDQLPLGTSDTAPLFPFGFGLEGR